MTMPAMAPPESPLELLVSAGVTVTLAPVAIGSVKGTVVVGLAVEVTTTRLLDVGRMGAVMNAVDNRRNVAAVVVTFNRLEKLKRVLASLESQTFLPKALIIVDNASTCFGQDNGH